MLAGVCGGLAEYLALDPMLIRVFFVVFALANGTGILLYLLLWIVLPSQESEQSSLSARVETGTQEIANRAGELGREVGEVARQRDPRRMTWIGVALVLVGAVLFLRQLDISWLAWLDFDVLWPVLLIAGGLALLLRRGSDSDE